MSTIEANFRAVLTKEANSGWIAAVWPGSKEYLGTGNPVRVGGTIDGVPFEATLMPFGNGDHFVPVKADMRKALGKGEGDSVDVVLLERIKG